MDIRQLRYFLAIAEEGQITSAAKKLHIAQPPLSQQLRLLEEELGVKLVERGPRRVLLTDAGKLLYTRAQRIVELTDTAAREVSDFHHDMRGVLRIGTVSSSGGTLLSQSLLAFHKQYPNIQFELTEANTYLLIDQLRSGLIEAGIVRTPFDQQDFEQILMRPEPMAAVYRRGAGFDLPKGKISLSTLQGKPLILYRRFEQILLGTFHSEGIEPAILCKNDDARTTLLWAKAGMGIALAPLSSLKLVDSAPLDWSEIAHPDLVTRIAVIWLKGGYQSRICRKFLEIFRTTQPDR